jgi:hypothetical protein
MYRSPEPAVKLGKLKFGFKVQDQIRLAAPND